MKSQDAFPVVEAEKWVLRVSRHTSDADAPATAEAAAWATPRNYCDEGLARPTPDDPQEREYRVVLPRPPIGRDGGTAADDRSHAGPLRGGELVHATAR
jgi:hypothetical protein